MLHSLWGGGGKKVVPEGMTIISNRNVTYSFYSSLSFVCVFYIELCSCSKGCKKSILWSVAAVEPAKEEEPTKEEDPAKEEEPAKEGKPAKEEEFAQTDE